MGRERLLREALITWIVLNVVLILGFLLFSSFLIAVRKLMSGELLEAGIGITCFIALEAILYLFAVTIEET